MSELANVIASDSDPFRLKSELYVVGVQLSKRRASNRRAIVSRGNGCRSGTPAWSSMAMISRLAKFGYRRGCPRARESSPATGDP